MTIIAYRAGCMAADSGCQLKEVHVGSIQKIWRLPNGYLYGACGECWDQDVRALLGEHGIDTPVGELGSIGIELQALVVTPKSFVFSLTINQTGNGFEVEFFQLWNEYYAIGAGSEIALGALAHGATAAEAVECTARHAPHVWLPVQSLRLGEGDGKTGKARKRRKVRRTEGSACSPERCD